MRREFYLLFLSLIINVFVFSQINGPTESRVTKDWIAGGIFEGKNPSDEIRADRTAFTKKFDLGNGKVDLYFGGPFHYKDKNGFFQDINLAIKRLANSKFNFINDENIFISRFAEKHTEGVEIELEGSKIIFGLNTKILCGSWSPSLSNNSKADINDNSILYQNIYDSIDIGYEVTKESVRHRMTFQTKEVFSGIPVGEQYITIEEFILLPDNTTVADKNGILTGSRTINGDLTVAKNGEVLFTIKSAHIWDASFTGNPEEQIYSDQVINSFQAVKTTVSFVSPGKLLFSVKIPVAWLMAPDRAFPVVFDPTVGIGNQTSFNSSYRYPFNTCRQQRVSQILFRKSDINAGGINTTGTITDIAFLQNTGVPIPINNLQVRMQEVTWNEMTTPTLTSSGFTTVYGPTTHNFTSGSNTWRTFTLSSPFAFTNTRNLLIEARFANSTFTNGCNCDNTAPGGYWGWYNSPYAGHRWAYSNNTAPPPSGASCEYNNSPERNPAYGYYIPATRITINTTGGCVPITFNNQPASQTVIAPAQVQFSVTVAGTTPAYQWEMSTNGGSTWGNVPAAAPYSGTTSNQLTINPTSTTMNGHRFRCRVTNTCTSPAVTSSTAVLTINAAGCATVVTPAASPNIPASGGTGSFAINVTPNTCSWSATETLSWVTITSPLNGTGDGTLNYTVAANTGGARSGSISVNGQTHTINQLGAAAPTTYTIYGRVIESGSIGLPGVTISTTPNQGTAITDGQGYYSLNVPLTYTGTVRATLAPYTFRPATQGVSSTNFSNKDFDADGVTMTVGSSVIPPWQREGDDYNGSITVQIPGTTTTAWHIEVDVYNSNNVHIANVQFPTTTTNISTFSASGSAAVGTPQRRLFDLSKNGYTLKYAAVFNANTSIQAYPGVVTEIIEKKWDKKNYVFYNSGAGQILIPLKYYPNTISATISFTRVASVSTENSKITNVPIVQFGNQKYYILNNVNSLIKGVDPGVFNYTISYNPSGFFQESGSFDLTKIGNVHNANTNSNNIVVLVGGIRNTIEKDIFDLPTSYNAQSNKAWSIANDLSLQYGINTWYIGQSNMNSTQKNAYDLGIALEEIRRLCVLAGAASPNISVVAHSKGGLEMRVLMDGKGAPASSNVNFTQNPLNPFTNVTINGSLKTVVFLGTPHHGSNFGYAIQNTPGGQDLIPSSPLINYLNNGTNVSGIRIANLSGYQINALGNSLVDIIGDGLVTLESSSQSININGHSLFRQFYLAEDYNPFGIENYLDFLLHSTSINTISNLNNFVSFVYSFSFHTKLHRSYRMNKPSNSCPTYFTIPAGGGLCQLQVIPGTTSMLSKILAVINNNNIPASCSSPNDISCFGSGGTMASVLPNVTVAKYINQNADSLLTKSDETGRFIFLLSDSLKKSEKIRFSGNGIESLILNLDSADIQVDKFPIIFFKSNDQTNRIKYPSVRLTNQEIITNQPILPIKISSLNTPSYDIMSNQDTAFRRITNVDTTSGLSLDTGLNIISVRFNGVLDSIILGKVVYYFPDSLFTNSTYSINVIANNTTINAKLYLNNTFYKEIRTYTSSTPLLLGKNNLTFSRFGYHDYRVSVTSPTIINLNFMQPISYSSLTDSTVFNFENRPNPQYWKTITVKNMTGVSNRQLSIRQFDDPFTGMSLKPQTRKFVFRKMEPSGNAAYYKTAIALDQINTPVKDSVYLLSIKGNRNIKYLPNEPGVTEYDPEVQKLQFNKLDFTSNSTHEIVLMQKQPPVMKPMDTIWHSGQTLVFPISMFVQDPDSIKNDITASSGDVKVTVNGDLVYVTAPVNFVGTTTFTLTGTHDWLSKTATYTMKVIPPEVFVPTGFTPNNDGRNDIIRPVFMGKLLYCHFAIYNRYGQKVFETKDCLAGWDGKIKGETQSTGTYVYYLAYRFEGIKEEEKFVKGVFSIIR